MLIENCPLFWFIGGINPYFYRYLDNTFRIQTWHQFTFYNFREEPYDKLDGFLTLREIRQRLLQEFDIRLLDVRLRVVTDEDYRYWRPLKGDRYLEGSYREAKTSDRMVGLLKSRKEL